MPNGENASDFSHRGAAWRCQTASTADGPSLPDLSEPSELLTGCSLQAGVYTVRLLPELRGLLLDYLRPGLPSSPPQIHHRGASWTGLAWSLASQLSAKPKRASLALPRKSQSAWYSSEGCVVVVGDVVLLDWGAAPGFIVALEEFALIDGKGGNANAGEREMVVEPVAAAG